MSITTLNLGRIKMVWTGAWVANTAYAKDDIVSYGANTYICIETHTSSSTFDANSSKFDLMAPGVKFAGTYTSTSTYKLNDAVSYGGSVYIALQSSTGQSPTTSTTYWSSMVSGVQYEGIYTTSTAYQSGDTVRYGGNTYIAKQDSINNAPTSSTYWTLYNEGFSLQGTYSTSTNYRVGQVVTHGANTYIAIADSINVLPSTTSSWTQLTSGQTSVGTFISTSTYRPGDLVQYGGYNYVCIAATRGDFPSNNAVWTQAQSGFTWAGTFNSATTYQKGEVVNYNGSSFVSTQFDNLAKNPDSNANYWSLMMQGSANNVYTTPGDLAYRSTSSIVRLPGGTSGQVLTVSTNGLPIWENNGYAGNVYYVSQNGVDAAGYGTTLERPFASLQYATQNCVSTSTIFVKAGSYYEQLPITVPANVAIIGDSLRNTFINPKTTGVSLDASPVANSSSTMFLLSDGALLKQMSFRGMTGFTAASTATNDITQAAIGGVFLRFNPASPIINKSPYVTDCSCFSTGGVGAILDGSVHASGNKSMVFHAYTNINDNGVGFWVKDNAKAEIVSCFTYYCYFGYATTGGAKIRSLNGNNSYGTYGVVSRGYDTSETPITCTLYGSQLTYNSNSLSGTGFSTSDVLTGLVSGARGTVTNVQPGVYKVYYKSISGTFVAGETVVGSISGSSAVIATGGVTGQKGFVLVVTGLASSPVVGTSIELTGDDSAYVIQTVGSWANSSSIVSIVLAQEKAVTSADGTAVRIRANFSQSRLTGHDFLNVGTGGVITTNYPGIPSQPPAQGNETVEVFPGRVFFITTDQDGNFRVGKYFAVNQATGQATLNASAFNLSGLSALRLGSIGAQLGELIQEFSSDVTLGSDSNTKVPTQHAVKTYVDTKTLADGSVTTSKIATGAITSSTIATGAVTVDKLTLSGVTTGTYGSSTFMHSITVDQYGRVTSASTSTITLSPTGVTTGTYGSSTSIPTITVGIDGRITAVTTSSVTSLPTQTGNSGKYLTTDGSVASWATVVALPSQTSNSGKFLTTDGTAASWATVSITPAAVSDQANSSTGYFALPVGTTAQRGSPSAVGATRINTSNNYFEIYAGSTAGWVSVWYMGQITAAGGNTVSTSGGYKYHTFTSAGTFSVSAAPAGSQIEVFVWGGGGGYGGPGGWGYGAAGGAGGAAYGILTPSNGSSYYVVIGGGGITGQRYGPTVLPGGGGGNASTTLSSDYGSGGGGYSAIFTSSTLIQGNVILMAGGGGGGGSSRAGTGNTGGAGGGTTGEDGASPYDGKPTYRGRGGTQSGGGAASDGSGNAGSALQGGSPGSYGGAGGGGYFGGSAGGYSESNTMGGGGGGCGYINTSYISGGALYIGSGTTPGNQSNTLRTGSYGLPATNSSVNGTQGIVIIRYPSAA